MLQQTVAVRPLVASDLDEAERIFRLAFGTWLKMAEPMQFAGDSSWIRTRFAGALGTAHVATVADRVVGSNFLANRGSVGYFGPLTVDPAWWGQRVAQSLVGAAIDAFTAWNVTCAGLATFPESLLHIALYRKFGFWPGPLTATLVREVTAPSIALDSTSYGAADAAGRRSLERAADAICQTACDGLTVAPEIRSVYEQGLGETVFVGDHALDGFAVCHCGAGSEAGSGNCRVKFAAARSGAAFARLADAWEALAAARGVPRVQAGMNYGREPATRALLARGYKAVRHTVVMYRPNRAPYDHADAWVIDDWR